MSPSPRAGPTGGSRAGTPRRQFGGDKDEMATTIDMADTAEAAGGARERVGAIPAPGAKPAGWLRKAWSGLRFLVDHLPLTWSGLILGALGAFVYFEFAESEADFVLMGFGLAAMALVATSIVAVAIAAPLYAWRVTRRSSGLPESLSVGIEHETAFHASRLPFVPIVSARHEWARPEAVLVRLTKDARFPGRWVEHVTPLERGRFELVERRFILEDVFGFARVRFTRRWVTPLRIQPVAGRADLSLAIRRATDDGYSHPSGQPLGELVEMRRYAAGDPVRHILWKVFARSRRLMVRQPERAIAPKPAMVGFFVAGRGDEPSASTARLFLENGLLGADFVFSAEGARRPTSDVGEAIEQVIESRDFRDSGADGLSSLLRSVDRGRLDNLVIFAPAADGPWVDKVLHAARRLPMPPTVVMTVDGALDLATDKKGKRSRLLFRKSRTLTSFAEVPSVYDRLRSAGIEPRVVHRGTGQPVEAYGIDAWRALQ